MLFGGCLALAYVAVVAAAVDAPWALLALATAPVAFVLARRVSRATAPPELVAVLVATARLDLATAILLAVGLWIA
jgi:1,4-dihydroxy-2-naphthoate octaprenyltransferase